VQESGAWSATTVLLGTVVISTNYSSCTCPSSNQVILSQSVERNLDNNNLWRNANSCRYHTDSDARTDYQFGSAQFVKPKQIFFYQATDVEHLTCERHGQLPPCVCPAATRSAENSADDSNTSG